MKILLADHNVRLRSLTKALIETREGWQVIEAIDGQDAIVKVAKFKPDIVVLDFSMPVFNGLQAAEKISAHFPNLPIILYTFYGFEAMNSEAKKHGIREVVDKAASGDSFLDTIAKYASQVTRSYPEPTPGMVDSIEKKEPPPVT